MSRSFVSMLAVVSIALAACAMDDKDDLGNADFSLTGHSSSGTTYRLRHADLTVDGPGGTQVFHTEDDLTRTVITTHLPPGAYTVTLATGWNLDRVNADGTTTAVDATLLSANPLAFTIASGTHTPVVLKFQAGADQVPMGDGDADISIDVTDPVPQALVVGPPSLTVLEGATGTFTVHLAAAPSSPVTVAVVTSTPSAIAVSPVSLTFTTANFAIDQTVTVVGVQDADAVDASADVTLTTAGSMVPPAIVHVAVTDDDVLSLVVTPGALTVQEGSSTSLSVQLSAQPIAPITISIVSANGSVATTAPASLTFDPVSWNVAQIVTVTGVHDPNLLDDSTQLILSASGLAPVTVPVIVKDIDAQAIVASTTNLTMGDVSSVTITAKLAFAPSANVVVTASSDNVGSLAVSPTSLTFTPANFAVPQALTLTAPNLPSTQTIHVTLGSPGVAPTVVTVLVKNVVFP